MYTPSTMWLSLRHIRRSTDILRDSRLGLRWEPGLRGIFYPLDDFLNLQLTKKRSDRACECFNHRSNRYEAQRPLSCSQRRRRQLWNRHTLSARRLSIEILPRRFRNVCVVELVPSYAGSTIIQRERPP